MIDYTKFYKENPKPQRIPEYVLLSKQDDKREWKYVEYTKYSKKK